MLRDISPRNWMQHLASISNQFRNRTLLNITIPGSHDAATYTMMDSILSYFAVTQTKTLEEQFNLGIRYFDIRLRQSKIHKKELKFFHGVVSSSTRDVLPNMKNFLDAVIRSKEIVILKLHFGSPSDFKLFQNNYLSKGERQIIISANEFKTATIQQLIDKNKRIALLTNYGGPDTDISLDYKSNTFGGWAKTRDPNKLKERMDKVRSTIDRRTECKLKIVQTNQPTLVGSGDNAFVSVLDQDKLPSSRAVIDRFVKESIEFLAVAMRNNVYSSLVNQVREAVRGVISLDNIGSDENKNRLIQDIIKINFDGAEFLRRVYPADDSSRALG